MAMADREFGVARLHAVLQAHGLKPTRDDVVMAAHTVTVGDCPDEELGTWRRCVVCQREVEPRDRVWMRHVTCSPFCAVCADMVVGQPRNLVGVWTGTDPPIKRARLIMRYGIDPYTDQSQPVAVDIATVCQEQNGLVAGIEHLRGPVVVLGIPPNFWDVRAQQETAA